MRPSHAVVLVLIALGLFAGPASAATPDPSVLPPANPGDPTLSVDIRGSKFCLYLTDVEGFARPWNGDECDEVRSVDLLDPWLRLVEPEAFGAEGREAAAGAVDAGTAAVRLHLRGGGAMDVATRTAGTTAGLGTLLRFFAVALPRGAKIGAVELLGADGLPRGETLAASPFGLGWLVGRFRMPNDRRVQRVLSPPQLQGAGWGARILVVDRPAPMPGQPMHRERVMCVDPAPARESDEVCAGPATAPYELAIAEGCGRGGRRVMAGLLPSAVGRLRLELADGRMLAVRSRTLGTVGAPSLRAFAVAAPVAVGVRAIWYARPGGGMTRDTLAIAPWSVACEGAIGGSSTAAQPTDALAHRGSLTTTGAPALHVAETPDRLCLALGRLADADDCQPVRSRIDDVVIVETPRGAAVAVDPRVVDGRIRRANGAVAVVPSLAAPVQAGPIAGHLRFILVGGGPGKEPVGFEGRMRDGRVVATASFAARYPIERGRPVVRFGDWWLRADVMRDLDPPGSRVTCGVVVRAGTDPVPDCDNLLFDDDTVGVSSRCDVGRVVVTGGVSRATRDVVLRGARAERIRATMVKRLPGGERGWIAVIPRRTAVTSIEHRARRGVVATARQTIPAASDQCGYQGWMRLFRAGMAGGAG